MQCIDLTKSTILNQSEEVFLDCIAVKMEKESLVRGEFIHRPLVREVLYDHETCVIRFL